MTVWLAEGALARWFDAALSGAGGEAPLVVADAGAWARSGAAEVILPAIRHQRYAVFSDFAPNPRLEDVTRALDAFWQTQPHDVVIAVGGGTALDLAKLVAVAARQAVGVAELIARPELITQPGVPLIAVPTTAGTGSEATQFAVVYVDGRKHSVDHPFLTPCAAIVDPLLTASQPRSVAAAAGLDCLCQAAESLWSVRSTDASIADATQALELAAGHLVPAVTAPSPAARFAMARASHLAGRAINTTRTTAPHALSYHLTAHYRVPHGMAVALTFGPLLDFTAGITAEDCLNPRGADHVRSMVQRIATLLGGATPKDASQCWQEILTAIDVPRRLADIGLNTPAALEAFANSANPARLANYPRRLTVEATIELFRRSALG